MPVPSGEPEMFCPPMPLRPRPSTWIPEPEAEETWIPEPEAEETLTIAGRTWIPEALPHQQEELGLQMMNPALANKLQGTPKKASSPRSPRIPRPSSPSSPRIPRPSRPSRPRKGLQRRNKMRQQCRSSCHLQPLLRLQWTKCCQIQPLMDI